MSSNEHDSHGEHGHGDYEVHAHISSTSLNVKVLLALFALTGLTLAAYLVRLGDANLMVALLISSMKATLVGYFFMHLSHEKPFNTLFFVGTLAFIAVFFFFTWNDTTHRGETDYRNGMRYDYRANEWAQGVPPELARRGGEELSLVPAPEGAAAPAEAAPAHH